ncbi:MAG: 23S rRNA (pseudouridine(1915)-N(3))-methyltransferase RlmH [Oscillospiraceae bacterium]|jgi:23S rRNA (pseudouridine1915-N3)-methyltransferase|nr:23S rRNA (pseudouridine(1915)-N(3))-methyltransferase RlmH [Oscillospiraceae bacterium]
MLQIKIIAFGKLKETYWREAVAEYLKRLQTYCKLEICELTPARLPDAPTPAQIAAALRTENRAALGAIPPQSAVAALCIEGKELSSEALSNWIRRSATDGGGCICFLIGSSYGLDETLKQRANLRLSMSPMTFPHQLARVMLLEQVYRAFQIASGGKYHK